MSEEVVATAHAIIMEASPPDDCGYDMPYEPPRVLNSEGKRVERSFDMNVLWLQQCSNCKYIWLADDCFNSSEYYKEGSPLLERDTEHCAYCGARLEFERFRVGRRRRAMSAHNPPQEIEDWLVNHPDAFTNYEMSPLNRFRVNQIAKKEEEIKQYSERQQALDKDKLPEWRYESEYTDFQRKIDLTQKELDRLKSSLARALQGC